MNILSHLTKDERAELCRAFGELGTLIGQLLKKQAIRVERQGGAS